MCGLWSMRAWEPSDHGSAHWEQGCWCPKMLGDARAGSKVAGAAKISVRYHLKTQLLSSHPSLQCSCNFLKSCLRPNCLYICYRDLKVLDIHEVREESWSSAPWPPAPHSQLQWTKLGCQIHLHSECRRYPRAPIHPHQRYHCKLSSSVYFATCKMPLPFSDLSI